MLAEWDQGDPEEFEDTSTCSSDDRCYSECHFNFLSAAKEDCPGSSSLTVVAPWTHSSTIIPILLDLQPTSAWKAQGRDRERTLVGTPPMVVSLRLS